MNATVPAVARAPSRPPTAALDHLSWSSIKTYATCPRKFAYQYIEDVPREFTAATLAFGSAFHAAADLLHQSRIEGAPLQGLSALLECYEDAWRTEIEHAPDVKFAKGEDIDTLHDSASRMLQAYREHLQSLGETGFSVIGIEHAIRFTLQPNVPPLEMRLDLLELTVAGDLVVTDLKTSRSRWNDTKAREHLPQLVLYANGLMPLLKELGAKRIVPRFVVVTKAKAPAVQVLEPTASQDDVVRLKQQVTETWAAIRAGVFVKRESWACAQCPYRKRCLG